MISKDKDNSGLIKSVQKSLHILKFIMESNDEVSLGDIAKSLGYNSSTTHHILKTLMAEGFVNQNKSNKKYDIGYELLFSDMDLNKKERYVKRAIPVLQQCVDLIGETTNLFIKSGDSAVCMLGRESDQVLRAYLVLGRKVPLMYTAAGRAFLINCSKTEISSIIKRHNMDTSKSVNNFDINSFMSEIEESRLRGYTLEKNEFDEMITAIGTPVLDKNSKCIFTLSTIAPSVRMNDEKIKYASEILIKASDTISDIFDSMIY